MEGEHGGRVILDYAFHPHIVNEVIAPGDLVSRSQLVNKAILWGCDRGLLVVLQLSERCVLALVYELLEGRCQCASPKHLMPMRNI